MASDADAHHYPDPSEEDIARAKAIWTRIGGRNLQTSARDVFEVLIGEHRLAVEQEAAKRLRRATWVLAGSTITLALATIALIFATLDSGGG